jgi:hypothetical protein
VLSRSSSEGRECREVKAATGTRGEEQGRGREKGADEGCELIDLSTRLCVSSSSSAESRPSRSRVSRRQPRRVLPLSSRTTGELAWRSAPHPHPFVVPLRASPSLAPARAVASLPQNPPLPLPAGSSCQRSFPPSASFRPPSSVLCFLPRTASAWFVPRHGALSASSHTHRPLCQRAGKHTRQRACCAAAPTLRAWACKHAGSLPVRQLSSAAAPLGRACRPAGRCVRHEWDARIVVCTILRRAHACAT